MAGNVTITEAEAAAWFDAYKKAWEERDVERAISLFTEDVDYRERRFGEPMLGHKTLRSYWQDRVFEHQRDISFSYRLWAVSRNECVAMWQAEFTWLPINGRREIDGICHLVMRGRENGGLLCSAFSEWMDHRDIV